MQKLLAKVKGRLHPRTLPQPTQILLKKRAPMKGWSAPVRLPMVTLHRSRQGSRRHRRMASALLQPHLPTTSHWSLFWNLIRKRNLSRHRRVTSLSRRIRNRSLKWNRRNLTRRMTRKGKKMANPDRRVGRPHLSRLVGNDDGQGRDRVHGRARPSTWPSKIDLIRRTMELPCRHSLSIRPSSHPYRQRHSSFLLSNNTSYCSSNINKAAHTSPRDHHFIPPHLPLLPFPASMRYVQAWHARTALLVDLWHFKSSPEEPNLLSLGHFHPPPGHLQPSSEVIP